MQVHILLCVTLEKCVPIFCILISRLAKQDLEVCIEGPGEQESRPLREDCQGSKQAGSGQERGRGHGDPEEEEKKGQRTKSFKNPESSRQGFLPLERGLLFAPGPHWEPR